jgi:predicted NBD/HSP70 family sugar kinase
MTSPTGDGQNPADTILGIDIGGTKTALMATARATGRRVATARIDTPREAGPGAFVGVLRSVSNAMLAGAGLDPRSVRAVGCAVPGPVDAHGLVIRAGNLGGWDHVPLQALLEQEWRAPAFVEQDANAGALGEMWQGVARVMNDFVFLALGTGVGAGIVLGKHLHRGAHHAAGEVGNLAIGPGAPGHGPRDEHNLAARIGSRALRARAREATGQNVRAADAAAGASADPRLAGIGRDAAGDLAVAVIAIASLLDPEAIVFGGGTAAAGEALLARVRECVKGELWVEPVLVLAELGEEAQLYGAIAGALARLDPDFRPSPGSR